jgi:hypothetical protein
MPSQGEAAFGQTPGIALLARQPRMSQPVHPAGRGDGGVTGELQEGDNARIRASSTLEIRVSSLKLALAQRGTIASEFYYFLNRPWGGRNVCVFTGLSMG